MVLFPPAKLNLGLHITGKRDDGFHDLESVFLPIGWSDILEVVLDEDVPSGQARFEWTGLAIPGDTVDNLVTRAHKRLAEAFDLPGVSIHLHKVLPMGGGVGGGSADGTYTLRALNAVCNLGLSHDALMAHAARWAALPLLLGRPRARTGEIVEPLQATSPTGWWVVVASRASTSGRGAFAGVSALPSHGLACALNPARPRGDSHSERLRSGARQRHPQIGRLIDALAEAGAAHAQMTGSGSAVFGLFGMKRPREAAHSPGPILQAHFSDFEEFNGNAPPGRPQCAFLSSLLCGKQVRACRCDQGAAECLAPTACPDHASTQGPQHGLGFHS